MTCQVSTSHTVHRLHTLPTAQSTSLLQVDVKKGMTMTLRGAGATAGGGERSQVEGTVSGGGEWSQVDSEGNGLRWRGAVFHAQQTAGQEAGRKTNWESELGIS